MEGISRNICDVLSETKHFNDQTDLQQIPNFDLVF